LNTHFSVGFTLSVLSLWVFILFCVLYYKKILDPPPLIKGKTTSSFKCIVCNATQMLEEGSAKLAAAITNKKFNDIGTAEVLVT